MWWVISVVIVGILINLFSSFLHPRMEKALAKLSESRRHRLEAREREFQEQVENLVANPVQITNLKIDVVLYHLRAIVYIVLGLMALNLLPTLDEILWNIGFRYFGVRGLAVMMSSYFVVAIATLISVLPIMDSIRRINRLVRAAEKRIHT
jgi:sterol desaturase/sphingolipid hydroxylase (fatty acid hydroxylase superfamily)